MPKTVDEIVQGQLGGLMLTVARLTAENEALHEQLAAAKAAASETKE